ncbi:DMT family transporter [Nanoarchaeota archaeon]
MQTKERSAYFYLGFTILLWSAVPAIAKLALSELNNLQVLFYANLIGIFSLFSVVLFQKKLTHFSKYNTKDYIRMFGMGFLGLFTYYILLYSSFSLAPAGQANMINYLWPVFIVIFSIIILKEKFNYKTILAILVSFIGALIVFTRGNLSNFQNQHSFGYLLAFVAALCYGLFSVLGKKLHYEKVTSILIYYISSFILITPTVLIFSEITIPKSITTILSLLFLGGLANSIGFIFWFKALKIGHTHKMANIVFLNPFLALIFVYFINAEIIPLISILGLVLIISGILIQINNSNI